MKRCPQCSQAYNDDMAFCLTDGATLVNDATPPPTVMFIPPPTPNTAQNETPAPTVFAGAQQQQQQFGQAPQFGGQAQFNQQPSAAAPPRKKSYLGIIIAVAAVLLLGIVGVVGGLGIYMYSVFNEPVFDQNTPTPFRTPESKTPEYSQDTAQGDYKNGFKRISTEDVTSRKFFPNANKTSASTYEDGRERVVSFLSVYDTPEKAEAAFLKHLETVRSEGKTITTRKDNYAYYYKGNAHSTAFWLSNKLYEFNTNNEQTLYRFAK